MCVCVSLGNYKRKNLPLSRLESYHSSFSSRQKNAPLIYLPVKIILSLNDELFLRLFENIDSHSPFP